jgi:spore coat protein U-like protein
VAKNCTVSATALPFGSYNGVALNVSSAVTVTCTSGTTYTVGLDQGKAAGATVTTRQMNITQPGTAGTGLNYNLLTTSYTGTNWGNTTGSWVSGSGTGSPVPITVYGVLPAGQFLPTGSYTDTITATVTY